MTPLTEFVISVSSSVTTLMLVFIGRQIFKLRKHADKLMTEHKYLMTTMQLVLQHIGLTQLLRDDGKK